MNTGIWIISKSHRAVISIAWALLFPHSAVAQYFPDVNEASLKGVKSFDASFITLVWMNLAIDKNSFQSNGKSAFELALRRDGVEVSTAAPNYLYCTLQATLDTGLVTFAYDVSYWDYNPIGLHTLLWNKSGIVQVGLDNFSADYVAKVCADEFANDWLAQNPR